MVWRWDDALNNETAPFFLVGTWMDITGAETKGGYDIKFGPMPTWKGVRLTPFVKTKDGSSTALPNILPLPMSYTESSSPKMACRQW